MTTTVDPYAQALRDLLVADHEAHLNDIQRRADEAAARGDKWYRNWHQLHVDRLRARPYPWERQEPSGS